MLYFGNSSTINLDVLYKSTLAAIDDYRVDEYLLDEKLTLNNIYQVEYNKKSSPTIKQSYAINGKYNILSKRETRAHAFYRMLGLPITDGQSFFNPGYDSDRAKDKIKIGISNRVIKTDSYKTLLQSFDYQSFLLQILQRKDINASVLVLSTLNIRNFADCIKDTSLDPLSITEDNLRYSVTMFDFNRKDYNQYVDVRDKKPTYLSSAKDSKFGKHAEDRRHYILPLMLDPKIVFSITNKKNINAPFFLLKGPNCDPEIQYSAPALQSIIIDRFSKKISPTEVSPSERKIIDSINQLPNVLDDNKQVVKDIKIIDSVFDKNKNNINYLNFINMATELMKILKQNVSNARKSQEKYHLVPQVLGSSPEQNLEMAKIYALDPNNSELDRKIVSEILQATSLSIQEMLSSFVNDDKKPVNSPQTTIFSNGAVTPVQNPSKKDSNKFNLASALNQRLKEEESMKRSLKYIEYLMGEISGFGICDMFVIMSAFYLLEDNVLISFLDDDCYDRAKDSAFGYLFSLAKIIRLIF